MLTLNRTLAFRRFQRAVGDCTAHINTAYVGTELIARGAKKPDDLHIKWQAPKSPRTFVDQTRSLLHTAMLGHVFMAVDRYLRDLAGDRWLPLTQEKRDILRKAVTKTGGRAYSVRERFAALNIEFGGPVEVDGLLVEALVIWRNRNEHEEISKDSEHDSRDSRLSDSTRKGLRTATELIEKRYGNFNIVALIDHLDHNRSPSRKDIVTLASAAQNYVRAVDGSLLGDAIRSEHDLEVIARKEVARSLLDADGRILAQLWGKDREARMRRINAVLQEVGFTTQGNVIAHHLSEDFVMKLASLASAKSAEQTLGTHLSA